MRRGDKRNVRFLNHSFEALYLGKGSFTKAWFRNGEKVNEVYLESTCHCKDALANFADQSNVHVPNIEWFDYTDASQETPVYKSTFYWPLMAKYEVAWQQFKILAKANEEARQEVISKHWAEYAKYKNTGRLFWDRHGYEIAELTIDKVRDELPIALIEALKEILRAASLYGSSVTFEFAKRNLAVDIKENLVLLDICYDTGQVKWLDL